MKNTRILTRAAAIAALYAVMTLVLHEISYGPWQFRVSEALTLLPCIWPEAIPGLFIGCLLANIIGPYGLVDIIVGSLATLLAAFLTRKLRGKKLVAALPPVLVNAVVIGVMLYFVAGAPLWMTMLQIGMGQAVSCFALGVPLVAFMERSGLARKL